MGRLRILASVLVGLGAYYFYTRETFSEEMVRGKRVLVTGSSSGIGEQIAYQFARMGAHVVVTARREKRLQEVVQKCLDLGASSAHYVVSDMNNLTSAQELVEEAKTLLGGLDQLVLNHIGGPVGFGPFRADAQSIVESMTVNFFSYIQLTVSALPMLQESQGNVIVVSSMCGHIPCPFSTLYSAEKFALEGFFGSLRLELYLRKVELSITVAVLGYIDTDTAMQAMKGKFNAVPSSKVECAREIVKGGVLRYHDVFYPYWSTKPMLLLQSWAPRLLDYLVGSAYNADQIH